MRNESMRPGSITTEAAQDPMLRLGLLMESAHAQQQAADSALERLERHVQGLDQVVRDQIRQCVHDSLQDLTEYLREAEEAVRRLARAARFRSALVSCVAAALCGAAPLGIGWWLAPSPAAIQALEQRRALLRTQIAQLEAAGGRAALRRCGDSRTCVRVDTHAPAFGVRGEYRVLAVE